MDQQRMTAGIEIYTTRFCPFCLQAKKLLKQEGAEFIEIDVGGQPGLRQEMIERAGGASTVPQIFIGGVHVGGCDDLFRLHEQGGLAEMLAA